MPKIECADPLVDRRSVRIDMRKLTQADLKRLPRIESKLMPGHPAFRVALRDTAIQRQRDVDWEGLEETKNEVGCRLQKVVEARAKGRCHNNSKADQSKGPPK